MNNLKGMIAFLGSSLTVPILLAFAVTALLMVKVRGLLQEIKHSEALRLTKEGMKSYRPYLDEAIIVAIVNDYRSDPAEDPLTETGQDVVWAYRRHFYGRDRYFKMREDQHKRLKSKSQTRFWRRLLRRPDR